MTDHADRVGWATHRGGVRSSNEDEVRTGAGVWIVADGMGGHDGGEHASYLAAVTASQSLEPARRRDHDAVRGAITLAHRIVTTIGHDLGSDMGTTLVVAARQDDRSVIIGWVGDSRAYLLDRGKLRRLTTDHNQAGEALAAGRVSSQAAREHPGRHLLTRVVGGKGRRPPRVDTVVIPASGRLLLCTDGLNGELSDRRIADLLRLGDPPVAAQRLVEAAVAAGGRDNVTTVVVDLTPMAGAPPAPAVRPKRRRPKRKATAALLGGPRPRGRVAAICGSCSRPITALGHCACA